MKQTTPDGAAIVGPVEIHLFGPEGQCFRQRSHAHDYDHWFFVGYGEVELMFRAVENGEPTETQVVRAGETVVVYRGVWHDWKDIPGGSIVFCVRESGAIEAYRGAC